MNYKNKKIDDYNSNDDKEYKPTIVKEIIEDHNNKRLYQNEILLEFMKANIPVSQDKQKTYHVTYTYMNQGIEGNQQGHDNPLQVNNNNGDNQHQDINQNNDFLNQNNDPINQNNNLNLPSLNYQPRPFRIIRPQNNLLEQSQTPKGPI